ncbi:hypothetical protein TRIATDRAFT_181896, partial [Trichoderma atroviride IMI 206040]
AAVLDPATAEQLNNSETRRLLDTIDGLRDLSITGIDLPQIIVVGNQCSGKSSVLEAISRVHFPVSDGICTRFPTELVLRRALMDSTDLRIRYATDAAADANTAALSFTRTPFHESGFQRSELPDVINRAKEHMGLVDGKATSFSKHVLRVEISGPDIPSLTLVDLPGIFHSGSSSQPQEWKPVVNEIVEGYMKQKNSIILMVVSADISLSKHAILDMALQHDTVRERTIGVITKVDLCPGLNLEDEYLRLARGQEPSHQLRLGWHVLRNRGPKELELDFDQRDVEEEKFLKTGAWSALPLSNQGVDSLRKSLGTALLKQIKSSLPALIRDIDGNLQNRQRRLAKLGTTRTTSDEMRDYLLSISTAFHKLAEHAVEGRYNDPFFATPSDPEARNKVKFRKLRALLRNLNYVFDLTMREKGAKYKMNWDEPQPRENPLQGLTDEEMLADALENIPGNLDPYIDLYDFPDPVVEEKGVAFTRIELLASDSQGAEFSGLPSNDFIMQLFRDQSEPWRRIAQCHVDNIVERTRLFIYQIFDYILEDDERTRDAILAECVDPFFDSMTNALKDKLDEIMRPYTSGHGIPLEIEFRAGVWRRKLGRMKSNSVDFLDQHSVAYNTTEYRVLKPEDVLNVLMQTDTSAYSYFGIDIAVDMMLTHYQMSRRTFTDNVVHLVVENCLISKLPDIFNPRVVTQMSDEILKRLAEESDEIKVERSQLADEIEKLKTGLQSCQRSRPRGFSESPAFGSNKTSTATTTTPVFGSVSALKSPLSAFGSVEAAQSSAAKLPVFGSTTSAATTSTSSPFGSTATSTSKPSAFGSMAATTSIPSAFGSTATNTSTPSVLSSTTASTAPAQTSSFFDSKPATTSTTSTTSSAAPAQISSFFGPKPANTSITPSSSGSTTVTPAFGSTTITAASTTQSGFGSNTIPAVSALAFGSISSSRPAAGSGFGSSAAPNPPSRGLFG